MANEAVKVELFGANNDGQPVRYTVPDNVNISIGTLLKIVTPRTASAALTNFSPVAGIAAMEKIAGDGSTSISVWTQGVFDITSSLAITQGAPVGVTGGVGTFANSIITTPTTSGAVTMGYAMDTAGTEDVINVRVNL